MMIRPATASDIPALARVHIASWQAAYRQLLPDEVLDTLCLAKFEAGWERNFSDPQRTNLLLEDERGVSGFIAFGASRDDDATPAMGEVYSLYVVPECWGTGYAQELWAQGVQCLSAHFSLLTLWTLQENVRARKFYGRLGCEYEGTTKEILLFGIALLQVRYRMVF